MRDGLFGVVSNAYLYKLSELIFIVWMRLYRPPPCGTMIVGLGMQQSDDHTYLEHDFRERIEWS